MSVSWKADVIADSTGKWCGNMLRFATKLEAETYVNALEERWSSVISTRVVESNQAVSHKIDHRGRAVRIDGKTP